MKNNLKLEVVAVSSKSKLDRLGSAITIEGLAESSFVQFAKWCDKLAKFKTRNPKCYVTTGRVMNRVDGLTGDNAYSDDLNIVSFDLDDFKNYEALIMPRFKIGARWLDDIRDNNRIREDR